MIMKMHCIVEEKLECATSLLQDEAYQWWISVTRTAPPERVTWKFFLDEFKKHYVGRIYLNNMRREFHNFETKVIKCNRISERIYTVEQVCSRDASKRRREVP